MTLLPLPGLTELEFPLLPYLNLLDAVRWLLREEKASPCTTVHLLLVYQRFKPFFGAPSVGQELKSRQDLMDI